MTRDHMPSRDADAIVEVRLVLQIPSDARVYEAHDVDPTDHDAVRKVVAAELLAWADRMGIAPLVDEQSFTVLTILERHEPAP